MGDMRRDAAEYYPGGAAAGGAGGGSGEGGGDTSPKVPVTQIAGLPERFRDGDVRDKVNAICRILSGGAA